jgi:hypothetical protein
MKGSAYARSGPGEPAARSRAQTHLRLDVAVDEVLRPEKLECRRWKESNTGGKPRLPKIDTERRQGPTELAEKALDDDLVQAALLRVDPEALGPTFGRDKLERRQPAALLDVEAQVATRAVVHDQVDALVKLLPRGAAREAVSPEPSRGGVDRSDRTHEAVLQPDDVGVMDGLEDRDLGLEVLEQLGRHLGPLDDLDGDHLAGSLRQDAARAQES